LRVFFELFGTASVDDFSVGQELFLGQAIIRAGSATVSISMTPVSDSFTSGPGTDFGFPTAIPRTFAKIEGTEFLNVALAASSVQNAPTYTLLNDVNTRLAGFYVVDTLYFGSNGANPADIFQGELPCWFAATVTSLANTRPQDIVNMIRDNNNGTYTVTFPGQRPVTVDAPSYTFPYNPYLASLGHSNGIWLPVLVKAYEATYGTFAGNLCRASEPRAFIRQLTGLDATKLSVNAPALEDGIVKTLGGNRLVVASTIWPENSREEQQLAAVGLVTPHAYTVVSYDPRTKVLTLRNPHGLGEFMQRPGQPPPDGRDDGLFTMSLADFRRYFADVTFELANRNPVPPRGR
jgi:hypothetical protein